MAKQKVALECLSYHATAPPDQTLKLVQDEIPSAEAYSLYSFNFSGKSTQCLFYILFKLKNFIFFIFNETKRVESFLLFWFAWTHMNITFVQNKTTEIDKARSWIVIHRHFCTEMGLIIPFFLSCFYFVDFDLNEDDTCRAAIRMFLQCNLVQQFHIPYDVSFSLYFHNFINNLPHYIIIESCVYLLIILIHCM